MTDQLNIVYFPAAGVLGALHALEPGHAKALTAAYLIGIKGTKMDSIVLGLSVAATHSLVVIAISAIGIWIGREAFAGQATHWLEMGSGLVALSIGSWMLWRRLSLKYRVQNREHHHHEADPVSILGNILTGSIEIIDSPLGERMRFISSTPIQDGELVVEIQRENEIEKLVLIKSPDAANTYLSAVAPAEPHEFSARIICSGKNKDAVQFAMKEPEGHHHGGEHDHAHLDDAAHAKAHAETLPDYAKTGERPSLGQIALFGAAGGMIPCPASITVMLLALSTGRTGMGIFTVLGFSLGLAISLVGIGLIVVSGLSKLSNNGRFASLSAKAPIISAGLVILSGFFALMIAIKS